MKSVLISTVLFILAVSTTSAAAQTQKNREVILATRWDRRVVIFDARTLAELGHFLVNEMANSVSADSRWLFGTTLWQGPSLKRSRLTRTLRSMSKMSRRNRRTRRKYHLAQRALPVIKAPGNYSLRVSPPGERLSVKCFLEAGLWPQGAWLGKQFLPLRARR